MPAGSVVRLFLNTKFGRVLESFWSHQRTRHEQGPPSLRRDQIVGKLHFVAVRERTLGAIVWASSIGLASGCGDDAAEQTDVGASDGSEGEQTSTGAASTSSGDDGSSTGESAAGSGTSGPASGDDETSTSSSTSDSGETAPPHDRLLVVLVGHSLVPEGWQTGGEGGPVSARLLEPLAGFEDRITVVEGLDNRAVIGGAAPPGELSHRGGPPSILTGGNIAIAPGTESCCALAVGPSIDTVLGQTLADSGPLEFLNLAVLPNPFECACGFYGTQFHFEADGTPREPFSDPRVAYDYLEANSDLSRDPEFTALALGPDYENDNSNFAVTADVELRLAELALARGVTRVATVNLLPPVALWQLPGQPPGFDSYHHLMHSSAQASEVAIETQLWISQRIADVAELLDQRDAGDGTTLLDHTLVVLVSDMGDPLAHHTRDIPVILIGNLSGRLTTGQRLVLPEATTADLWMTVATAMDAPLDGFGAPELDAAPIPELLAR